MQQLADTVVSLYPYVCVYVSPFLTTLILVSSSRVLVEVIQLMAPSWKVEQAPNNDDECNGVR